MAHYPWEGYLDTPPFYRNIDDTGCHPKLHSHTARHTYRLTRISPYHPPCMPMDQRLGECHPCQNLSSQTTDDINGRRGSHTPPYPSPTSDSQHYAPSNILDPSLAQSLMRRRIDWHVDLLAQSPVRLALEDGYGFQVDLGKYNKLVRELRRMRDIVEEDLTLDGLKLPWIRVPQVDGYKAHSLLAFREIIINFRKEVEEFVTYLIDSVENPTFFYLNLPSQPFYSKQKLRSPGESEKLGTLRLSTSSCPRLDIESHSDINKVSTPKRAEILLATTPSAYPCNSSTADEVKGIPFERRNLLEMPIKNPLQLTGARARLLPSSKHQALISLRPSIVPNIQPKQASMALWNQLTIRAQPVIKRIDKPETPKVSAILDDSKVVRRPSGRYNQVDRLRIASSSDSSELTQSPIHYDDKIRTFPRYQSVIRAVPATPCEASSIEPDQPTAVWSPTGCSSVNQTPEDPEPLHVPQACNKPATSSPATSCSRPAFAPDLGSASSYSIETIQEVLNPEITAVVINAHQIIHSPFEEFTMRTSNRPVLGEEISQAQEENQRYHEPSIPAALPMPIANRKPSGVLKNPGPTIASQSLPKSITPLSPVSGNIPPTYQITAPCSYSVEDMTATDSPERPDARVPRLLRGNGILSKDTSVKELCEHQVMLSPTKSPTTPEVITVDDQILEGNGAKRISGICHDRETPTSGLLSISTRFLLKHLPTSQENGKNTWWDCCIRGRSICLTGNGFEKLTIGIPRTHSENPRYELDHGQLSSGSTTGSSVAVAPFEGICPALRAQASADNLLCHGLNTWPFASEGLIGLPSCTSLQSTRAQALPSSKRRVRDPETEFTPPSISISASASDRPVEITPRAPSVDLQAPDVMVKGKEGSCAEETYEHGMFSSVIKESLDIPVASDQVLEGIRIHQALVVGKQRHEPSISVNHQSIAIPPDTRHDHSPTNLRNFKNSQSDHCLRRSIGAERSSGELTLGIHRANPEPVECRRNQSRFLSRSARNRSMVSMDSKSLFLTERLQSIVNCHPSQGRLLCPDGMLRGLNAVTISIKSAWLPLATEPRLSWLVKEMAHKLDNSLGGQVFTELEFEEKFFRRSKYASKSGPHLGPLSSSALAYSLDDFFCQNSPRPAVFLANSANRITYSDTPSKTHEISEGMDHEWDNPRSGCVSASAENTNGNNPYPCLHPPAELYTKAFNRSFHQYQCERNQQVSLREADNHAFSIPSSSTPRSESIQAGNPHLGISVNEPLQYLGTTLQICPLTHNPVYDMTFEEVGLQRCASNLNGDPRWESMVSTGPLLVGQTNSPARPERRPIPNPITDRVSPVAPIINWTTATPSDSKSPLKGNSNPLLNPTRSITIVKDVPSSPPYSQRSEEEIRSYSSFAMISLSGPSLVRHDQRPSFVILSISSGADLLQTYGLSYIETLSILQLATRRDGHQREIVRNGTVVTSSFRAPRRYLFYLHSQAQALKGVSLNQVTLMRIRTEFIELQSFLPFKSGAVPSSQPTDSSTLDINDDISAIPQPAHQVRVSLTTYRSETINTHPPLALARCQSIDLASPRASPFCHQCSMCVIRVLENDRQVIFEQQNRHEKGENLPDPQCTGQAESPYVTTPSKCDSHDDGLLHNRNPQSFKSLQHLEDMPPDTVEGIFLQHKTAQCRLKTRNLDIETNKGKCQRSDSPNYPLADTPNPDPTLFRIQAAIIARLHKGVPEEDCRVGIEPADQRVRSMGGLRLIPAHLIYSAAIRNTIGPEPALSPSILDQGPGSHLARYGLDYHRSKQISRNRVSSRNSAPYRCSCHGTCRPKANLAVGNATREGVIPISYAPRGFEVRGHLGSRDNIDSNPVWSDSPHYFHHNGVLIQSQFMTVSCSPISAQYAPPYRTLVPSLKELLRLKHIHRTEITKASNPQHTARRNLWGERSEGRLSQCNVRYEPWTLNERISVKMVEVGQSRLPILEPSICWTIDASEPPLVNVKSYLGFTSKGKDVSLASTRGQTTNLYSAPTNSAHYVDLARFKTEILPLFQIKERSELLLALGGIRIIPTPEAELERKMCLGNQPRLSRRTCCSHVSHCQRPHREIVTPERGSRQLPFQLLRFSEITLALCIPGIGRKGHMKGISHELQLLRTTAEEDLREILNASPICPVNGLQLGDLPSAFDLATDSAEAPCGHVPLTQLPSFHLSVSPSLPLNGTHNNAGNCGTSTCHPESNYGKPPMPVRSLPIYTSHPERHEEEPRTTLEGLPCRSLYVTASSRIVDFDDWLISPSQNHFETVVLAFKGVLAPRSPNHYGQTFPLSGRKSQHPNISQFTWRNGLPSRKLEAWFCMEIKGRVWELGVESVKHLNQLSTNPNVQPCLPDHTIPITTLIEPPELTLTNTTYLITPPFLYHCTPHSRSTLECPLDYAVHSHLSTSTDVVLSSNFMYCGRVCGGPLVINPSPRTTSPATICISSTTNSNYWKWSRHCGRKLCCDPPFEVKAHLSLIISEMITQTLNGAGRKVGTTEQAEPGSKEWGELCQLHEHENGIKELSIVLDECLWKHDKPYSRKHIYRRKGPFSFWVQDPHQKASITSTLIQCADPSHVWQLIQSYHYCAEDHEILEG